MLRYPEINDIGEFVTLDPWALDTVLKESLVRWDEPVSVLSWLILQKRFELIVEKTIRYIRVSRRIKRVSVERGSTVVTDLKC